MVGYSLDLVGRFIKAYPQTVVGLKDSSGDWNNTAALLDRYPGFAIFPGSEVFLLDALRKGGAGCITASGNVNVPGIAKLYANWQGPQADALQAEVTTVRKTLQRYPMVPALKRVVAHFHDDPDWAAVRPPMLPLDQTQSAALIADLAKIGFSLGERRQKAADADLGGTADGGGARRPPGRRNARRSTTGSPPANLAPLWERLHALVTARAGDAGASRRSGITATSGRI